MNRGLLGFPVGVADPGPRAFPAGPIGGYEGLHDAPRGRGLYSPDNPLRDAFLVLDAAQYDGSNWWRNVGTAGEKLNAEILSGATYFPVWLAPTEAPYFFSSGGNSYLYVDDEASFHPTTTLDYRAAFTMQQWSGLPASTYVGGQYQPSGNLRSWRLAYGTTGVPWLGTSDDGATVVQTNLPINSSTRMWELLGFEDGDDGQVLCVRVVWTSAGTADFYCKASTPLTAYDDCADDTGWTQVGTQQTATTSLYDTTTWFGPFGDGGGNSLNKAKNYAALLIVDGSTVFDFDSRSDLTTEATSSFTAKSGQTVTINKSGGSGLRSDVVMPSGLPRFLFGTDRYMKIASDPRHALMPGVPLCGMVVVRGHQTYPGRILWRAGNRNGPQVYGSHMPGGWGLGSAAGSDPRFRFFAEGQVEATGNWRADSLGSVTTLSEWLRPLVGFFGRTCAPEVARTNQSGSGASSATRFFNQAQDRLYARHSEALSSEQVDSTANLFFPGGGPADGPLWIGTAGKSGYYDFSLFMVALWNRPLSLGEMEWLGDWMLARCP